MLKAGLLLLSPFNKKAKNLRTGQEKALYELEQKLSKKPGKYIWFHCASLGEFEQGRPVIEQFRQANDDFKILITFFSPSGYEVRKDYGGADIVSYLPLDTKTNAQKFIRLVKPEMAIFVKYEFWLHYLKELNKYGIPVISISSVFRQDQFFFKKYGAFYRKFLNYFEHFFVQDETSRELLLGNGFNNVTVSGDTRFDRVYEIGNSPMDIPLAKSFSTGQKVMVIGSSWPEDIELLMPLFKQDEVDLKYIIAPHEIDTYHLHALKKTIDQPVIMFSKAKNKDLSRYKFLIIDNIGLLSSLYRYGDMAYVGGAFGQGLHNILEPAAFGIPVFFGKSKKNEKYLEASELVKAGGAFDIETSVQLIKNIRHLLINSDILKRTGQASKQYITDKTGATEAIIAYLRTKMK